MELGGGLLTGKKSTSELFSRIITSDEIDHDYISKFYNHDLSIQYKYGIVKPDQICNLLNEESLISKILMQMKGYDQVKLLANAVKMWLLSLI